MNDDSRMRVHPAVCLKTQRSRRCYNMIHVGKGGMPMAVNLHQSIFTELADFLVSQPTLEDIAAYKVSSGIQQQIDTLLEKNTDGGLTPEERLELEKILAVSQVMTLAKTKARLKLASNLTAMQ
ncbi:MAG: hypothetical protein JNM70_07760 [Anaerolineae bacterium]|nr:hypothetical protein [Anaerolineae bacterium]